MVVGYYAMDRDSEQLGILLVDDYVDDRALTRSLLTTEFPQATIVEAASALEFAQAFAAQAFSIAISEYDLGWASGSEILGSIKRNHTECATILFTREGACPPENFGLGADAHLEKSSGGFVALPGLVEATLQGSVPSAHSVTVVAPLWDRLPVGVFTLSGDGEILTANRAFGEILQFSDVRDALGRQLPDLLTDRDARVELRHLLERKGRGEDLEVELRTTGRSLIRAVLSLWPTERESPNVTNPDVSLPYTPINKARLSERQFQGMLANPHPRSDQSPLSAPSKPASAKAGPSSGQDHVTATLFGELLDPLQLLSQYARAMRERCGETVGEEGFDILERMQTVSGRLQIILRGMQGYTANQRERSAPLEQVSLAGVISQTLSDFKGQIAQSRAEITVEPLPTLVGDRELLRLLFGQLIDNSLKFHANEPPMVRIGAEERTNDRLLTVQDNGLGIPEAASERVFEIFERLHDPDAYPGEGVGLSICRYIASRHGGDIWVRPAQPHGCIFLITVSKQLQVSHPLPNSDPRNSVSELDSASSQ